MAREMKDSGIEWIGEIPKSWITTKIKNLPNNEENSYIDGDWIESPYITDNGIRYLTTGNIGDGHYKEQGDGYISEDTFLALKCKYAYPGDLVFSRLNEPYGRSCILPDFHPKYVLAVDNVILRTNENKSYICYISQCKGFQNSVLDMARGTTMKRISRINLGSVIIPLPSNKEQHRIVSFLDPKCAEIDKAIEVTKASIEEYRKLRQAIITEAVTAEDIPRQKFKYCAIVKANLVSPEDFPEMFQIAPDNIEKDTGRLLIDSVKTVKESGVISDNHLFHKGQILYSKIRPVLNKVTIAPFDGLCCADMYPVETITNTKYLVYSMLSSDFLRQVKAITEERVKMPKINQEELGGIIIGVPSKSKQEEIVSFLDSKCSEIDSLINSKEKLIEELTAYRKSLIYEYVTGKKEVPAV